MIKVAINGFGRIGRNFFRAYLQDVHAQSAIQVVAINVGPAKKEWIAQLFTHDTFMGTWPDKVWFENGFLQSKQFKIPILSEIDPLHIDWKALHVDWVVDATGKFTKAQDAQKHITAGAKRVLITAFAQGADKTIVLGVNDDVYDPDNDRIVSLGSCTANAFFPLVKVLHEALDIDSFMMNTIHSYTNRQVFMDVEASTLRRSRSATVNIIPVPAQEGVRLHEVYPAFKGTVCAQTTRVPVSKVSLLDVVFTTNIAIKREDINDALQKARDGRMKGIVNTSDQELVSMDFANSSYSVIVDEPLTMVTGSMGKIWGWYDNEAGYSHRIKDFLVRFG